MQSERRSLAQKLRRLRDYIRERRDPIRRFRRYFKASEPRLSKPEPLLQRISLPSEVTTVMDIGCGSGRNFLPFKGTHRLVGIDLVPRTDINWIVAPDEYHEATLKTFTGFLERTKPDLSNTLVMTYGSLMYASRRLQLRFWEVCRSCGCKYFLFMEYPPEHGDFGRHFKLPSAAFEQQRTAESPSVIAYSSFPL